MQLEAPSAEYVPPMFSETLINNLNLYNYQIRNRVLNSILISKYRLNTYISGSDIPNSSKWSLRRPFSFTLPYSAPFLDF